MHFQIEEENGARRIILMLRIRIIIRSAREPYMEPSDRPQGAVHQHAACGLDGFTQYLTPV